MMNAIEEYESIMVDCFGTRLDYVASRYSDAAIAELEAENLKWQDESLKNLIAAGEAEAELARLKSGLLHNKTSGHDGNVRRKARAEEGSK